MPHLLFELTLVRVQPPVYLAKILLLPQQRLLWLRFSLPLQLQALLHILLVFSASLSKFLGVPVRLQLCLARAVAVGLTPESKVPPLRNRAEPRVAAEALQVIRAVTSRQVPEPLPKVHPTPF